MIVTRTPFRVTLGGGGTDLPAFYRRYGANVLSMGIDKYMYVALNVPYADKLVRLHYTQSETVGRVEDLKHELAREALLHHGIRYGIEIASLADLPAGSGLGSSSCYLVGLLNAVRTYLLRPATFEQLADEACTIELDLLKKPIGKQDQYMAAFGGLTELHITRDGEVTVSRVTLPNYAISELISKTHMYHTNVQRSTIEILSELTAALVNADARTDEILLQISELGLQISQAIKACDFDRFGRLLHEHWMAKKRLSDKISLDDIDELYDYVRAEFGVLGGKIIGAGGGGFLQLYCPDDGRRLTEYMEGRGFARLPYEAEFEGSKVLINTLAARSVHAHLNR